MSNEVDFFGCSGVDFNRDTLITCLYNSAELNHSIQTIVSGSKHIKQELIEELKSELFLSLCEIDESELKRIYETGYLNYYVQRVIRNMFAWSGGNFNRNIRNGILARSNEVVFIESTDTDYVEISDAAISDAIGSLNWFEKHIVDLYISTGTEKVNNDGSITWKTGSIKKVCETAGVSVAYANKVMASARQKFKDALH